MNIKNIFLVAALVSTGIVQGALGSGNSIAKYSGSSDQKTANPLTRLRPSFVVPKPKPGAAPSVYADNSNQNNKGLLGGDPKTWTPSSDAEKSGSGHKLVGGDSSTWAPLTVQDSSGSTIGTARVELHKTGFGAGRYQATGGSMAQPAFVLDTSKTQKIGTITQDGNTFDVYVSTAAPAPVVPATGGIVPASVQQSTTQSGSVPFAGVTPSTSDSDGFADLDDADSSSNSSNGLSGLSGSTTSN